MFVLEKRVFFTFIFNPIYVGQKIFKYILNKTIDKFNGIVYYSHAFF